MPPRGFDQGDLVMAMLRYFRPRVVSEEGSRDGCSVSSASLRRGLASSVSLRFRAVSSSATWARRRRGEAHEAMLDAPGHAVLVADLLKPTELQASDRLRGRLALLVLVVVLLLLVDVLLLVVVADSNPHYHSIFCLLSLTPDATNAMLFSSRFVASI